VYLLLLTGRAGYSEGFEANRFPAILHSACPLTAAAEDADMLGSWGQGDYQTKARLLINIHITCCFIKLPA
jgi:hypothetical protein